MTCASCANRIERKLNKLTGVHATVNYATEKAHVTTPRRRTTRRRCIATVEEAGYGARRSPPPDPTTPATAEPASRCGAGWSSRRCWPCRWWCWRWSRPCSSTTGSGCRSRWPAGRRLGRAGRSTGPPGPTCGTAPRPWTPWSRSASAPRSAGRCTRSCFGTAGRIGMPMPFRLTAGRGDGAGNIYLEVAAGVTTFLLAGRYLEARSKRRAGAALRALLELGAKDVAVLRDGVEVRVPDRASWPSATSSWCGPGEKIATDGVVVERRAPRSTPRMLTGESVPVEVGAGDAVVGATVNAGGRLVVRATRVGADTQLAQIARLVAEAQTGKAAVQRLADRVSGVFVPVVLGARRWSRWPAGCWPAARADRRVHRRGRGADHRLPVRARAGHADRAAGRHRPRRPARHPDQGPRGAGVDPPRRHRRARQDRHRHHRADDAGRGASPAAGTDARPSVLRLAGALEDASEHPIAPGRRRRGRPRELGALPPSRRSPTWPALGVRGVVDGPRGAGRPARAARRARAGRSTPSCDAALAAAEADGRTAVCVGWDGARSRRARRRRHRQADQRRRPSGGCARWG